MKNFSFRTSTRLAAFLIGSGLALVALKPAIAQDQVVAQICNGAGVCAPVEPMTALIIIGIQTVVDELNKGKKGFGPNGEIMKAVNTVLGDLRRGGLGENNDLVKAWETIKNDVLKGPGPNNDIVKALRSINVKL